MKRLALALMLLGLVPIITVDSLIQDEMRLNRDGLLMPVRGLIQTFTHRSFNRLPAPYRPRGYRWEDYGVAATPLVATWVLKACGVKSRSTTRRLLVSNGLALGLTTGLSQTLRWTVTEERPDGLGSNSLPSFHAAIAYMGATVLSREYGHISPWVSIGGYTVATGTQMLRIRHNAHWMNDIAMGAGIGVVSTNLAYFLTDRLLGTKGVRPMLPSASELTQLQAFNHQPSGLRLVTGTETSGRDISVEGLAETAEGFDATGVRLRSSASITSGFEAEWYLTDVFYLSAIARCTISQAKLQVPSPAITAWGEQMHIYHGDLAAGAAFPLMPLPGVGPMRLGIRTLWGVRYSQGITFRQVAPGHSLGQPLLSIDPQLRPAGGAGVGIDMLQSHNQTVGFSFDYLHTFGTRLLPDRWVIASSWKAIF